jgi:hypothetical protein
MSTGNAMIVGAITFVFLLYAGVLMWADSYSRKANQ